MLAVGLSKQAYTNGPLKLEYQTQARQSCRSDLQLNGLFGHECRSLARPKVTASKEMLLEVKSGGQIVQDPRSLTDADKSQCRYTASDLQWGCGHSWTSAEGFQCYEGYIWMIR